MFNLSEHSKEETGFTGKKRKNAGRVSEAAIKDLLSCPSILTGMSHEVRTEMNSIVAFSYLLNKNNYSTEEREEYSKNIFSSCEKIISLFDNFLDAAIIDTGNSESESANCCPDQIINSLFTEFREILKQERYRDIIFVADSQPLQNSWYSLDMNRITRVIRNLFRNAVSCTRSGYIKAGYELSNEKLTFYVLDSGDGYFKCKEFLESQAMTQSMTKFNDTVTAVNLTLTRKLIQMMGGSLWIECNGFSGSAIYFSVPLNSKTKNEITIKTFSNTISTI